MRHARAGAPAEGDRGILTVPSSSTDAVYTVSFSGPYMRHCTCPGWYWRGRCRHVAALDRALADIMSAS